MLAVWDTRGGGGRGGKAPGGAKMVCNGKVLNCKPSVNKATAWGMPSYFRHQQLIIRFILRVIALQAVGWPAIYLGQLLV